MVHSDFPEAEEKKVMNRWKTSSQSDQSLCCPLTESLTESLDTKECINEKQMHG